MIKGRSVISCSDSFLPVSLVRAFGLGIGSWESLEASAADVALACPSIPKRRHKPEALWCLLPLVDDAFPDLIIHSLFVGMVNCLLFVFVKVGGHSSNQSEGWIAGIVTFQALEEAWLWRHW
jgi:hypothetical protein